jgi:superfamily II DNA or RNA helicase
MKLRKFQNDASDSVFAEFEKANSTLVVLPTGCGKTVVFADVSRRMYEKTGRRVMVIAHREELIFQARDKIMTFAGLEAQVEMGEYRVDKGLFGYPPVIVSTVQTHTAGGDGCGRMAKFDPMDFGLLIIDEAHHATADSYKRVIEWYMRNPNMKLLGVTATPDRTDEEALGQVFGSVACNYEVLHAIHDGWLVPVKQEMAACGHLDLSSVRTTAGDLNAGDLEAILNDEKTLHEFATPIIENCVGKRALVFAATVSQAERLCEILNRHRSGCASFVCGKTEKEERKRLLSEFKVGKTQYVVNVGVLTEGFDDDGVEVVVMARPTKSRALYAQMAGRGTRPHSSIAHALGDMDSAAERVTAIKASPKPGCLIIDFVGNCGRHKLVTTADILGGNYSEEEVAKAKQRAKSSSVPVDMSEALEQARLDIEEAKRREAAKRAAIVCRSQYSMTSVDPFDVFQIHKTPERGWDKHKSLSEAQLEKLKQQGISTDGLSYSECKQLLDEVFRRFRNNECSFKQVKTLKKFGYSGPIKRDQAKALIDRIAANGWRAVQ